MRIQRRRSGSDDVTADCIASNVGRLTLLAKSDASTGELQPRRRFRAIASPLIAFIAAATGTSTFGQARSSASYAARRTDGVGIGRQPPHGGHRQDAVAVGQFDLGGELRGDVGVESAPRRRTGEREFGGQMLLRLGHLVAGAGGQATQRTAVVVDLAADVGQVVDAERRHPVGEPGRQRAQRRVEPAGLAEHGLGPFVAGVGGHGGVDVRTQQVDGVGHPVELAQCPICRRAVVGRDGTGAGGADVEFVEQRDEPVDVGAGVFERIGERSRHRATRARRRRSIEADRSSSHRSWSHRSWSRRRGS